MFLYRSTADAFISNWLFLWKHWHVMQSPSVTLLDEIYFLHKSESWIIFVIVFGWWAHYLLLHNCCAIFLPQFAQLFFHAHCIFLWHVVLNLQDRCLWVYADYIFWTKLVCGGRRRGLGVFIGAFLWAGSAGDSFDTGRLWFTQEWTIT